MTNSNSTTITFENPITTDENTISNTVEVEIIGTNDVENRLVEIQNQLCELDGEIEKLTSDADKLDYFVAVGSGIITGVIDILFVGKFDLDKFSYRYRLLDVHITRKSN